MVFPETDWEIRTPETQGVDSAGLNEAIDYLHANSGGAGASEVVVIRNGYMIWKGSNIDHMHTINSCTKTFTTTVLGLLIQDGKLALDDFAVEYLPSLDDKYPAYAGIKFRHFASMTSGYTGQKGNITKDMQWGDPSKYLTPDKPLFAPGTAFHYHDPAIHQLGYILTKIAGEPMETFFKRRIADPIGLKDWDWKDFGVVDEILLNSPSGIYEGGIHITARQMARFGHLYLNRGNWNGKQLIDASWVDQATTTQVPPSLPLRGYRSPGQFGFMWWTNGVDRNGNRPWPSAPSKTYAARGGNRNTCWVIPEWNMVIVRMEKTIRMQPSDEYKIWDNFFKILKEGILEPLANLNPHTITGELKVWHTVTISFEGPYNDELDNNPNPFLDYRLQVFFTSPNGNIFNVPGFFDGDGNGAGSGNIWRAHFTPDSPGTWKFQPSFRQGTNVANSLDLNDGIPTSFDGTGGSFNIFDFDQNAPGFLSKGRLVYDDGFYLKTLGDGKYWIKGGSDSPENFLAYYGFDGTSAGPFGIHHYAAHIDDWNSGDPDWGNGKGKGIIGALNYLSLKKVNSIYFLTMNIGGDGQDTWPYSGVINRAGSRGNDNKHFDIGKLKQWEIVFSHTQKKGINLNFVLAEGEKMNKWELSKMPIEFSLKDIVRNIYNWIYGLYSIFFGVNSMSIIDNTQLGVERKLYFREMIARFGHHNALQWMLCEEYDHRELALDSNLIKSWAQYIRDTDPYDHPVSVHNMAETGWKPFFGDNRFDLTSYQFAGREMNGLAYSNKVESLRNQALTAKRKIAISIDEPVTTSIYDNEDHTVKNRGTWQQHIYGQMYIRKNVIYPIYFSGGSVELILQDSFKTEDFQQYNNVWDYMYYARRFMEDNLPFWEMEPMDQLLTDEAEKGQVFAKKGEIYAIYLPKAKPSGNLNLSDVPGTFEKRWYNPRTGQFEGLINTINGNSIIALGLPPIDSLQDWVVLLKREGFGKQNYNIAD